MSNLAYQELAKVLAEILERLIRVEQRLECMETQKVSGNKKAVQVSLPEQPNIK